MDACSSNDMQSICFFYFIIRDEFEFDDLKYCVLISVLRLTHFSKSSTSIRFRSTNIIPSYQREHF